MRQATESMCKAVMSEDLDCTLTHVTTLENYESIRITDNFHTKRSLERSDKPFGFWLSVDYDWERWCRYEMPSWFDSRHVSVKVELPSGLRFLSITSAEEVRQFIRTYAPEYEHKEFNYCPNTVDWSRVRREYDGVYFANYFACRDESSLFYSWDVDCICVFRPKSAGVALNGYLSSATVKNYFWERRSNVTDDHLEQMVACIAGEK